MIHPDCFQRPWLAEQGAALNVQSHNLHLLERCIHALELVGRLSDAGLDFVFKGGTSLVLLLNPIRRLSIDVDIATPEPIERIKAVLDQIAVNRPPFLRYEHQERRDRDAPPTRHFKIHFSSVAGHQVESYILLDVITGAHGYAATERRSVATPFIKLEADSQVVLPTVDCILGDKLAAFAPRTIGVLFDPLDRNGRPRERDPLQIVKQLFDVGHLFAEATNLDQAATSYCATFESQNRYRGGNFTLNDCLDDTIDAARSLCLMPSAEAAAHTPHQSILRAGQRGLGTHLLTEPFTLDRHARVAAARAALLATLIRHGRTIDIPRNIVRSVPPSSEFQYIRLPELARRSPYLALASIRTELKARKVDLGDDTLQRYLHEFVEAGSLYDAGRGWYSTLAKPLAFDRAHIAPVVDLIEKAFPLLSFAAWSTQQINPWMHHLLGKFVTFVYVEKEGLDPVWEDMVAEDGLGVGGGAVDADGGRAGILPDAVEGGDEAVDLGLERGDIGVGLGPLNGENLIHQGHDGRLLLGRDVGDGELLPVVGVEVGVAAAIGAKEFAGLGGVEAGEKKLGGEATAIGFAGFARGKFVGLGFAGVAGTLPYRAINYTF
jgi:hypothetical protein